MQETIPAKLEDLIKSNKKDITAVLAQAVEIGVSKLWADFVLEKYLSKKSREKKPFI